MSETKVVRPKRLPKAQAIQSLLSNFALLQAGIPGIGVEEVKVAMAKSEQYLYESEIEDVTVKEIEKNPAFDAELFLTLLVETDSVVEKAAAGSALANSQVRINSDERCLEVANSPELAPAVKAIIDQIVALRDEITPLINENASCSIAFKNKKTVEKDSSEDENDSEDL